MIDDDDPFETLLRQHTKKRATPVNPGFPKAGPIYGPLRLIMQKPPNKLVVRQRDVVPDRRALLDKIASLEAENAELKRQLALHKIDKTDYVGVVFEQNQCNLLAKLLLFMLRGW